MFIILLALGKFCSFTQKSFTNNILLTNNRCFIKYLTHFDYVEAMATWEMVGIE
jgi:hypothetical protein